jgi:hypothetical protein
MSKINCWEHKGCGRELGGANAETLGVCPATTETKLDGLNSGKNGGRACWPIAGTLCGGEVQGTFATKVGSCMACDFFKLVCKEEESVEKPQDIIKKLAG